MPNIKKTKVRSQTQEKNWSDGVLENWSPGKALSKSTFHYSITPTLQYSNSESPTISEYKI